MRSNIYMPSERFFPNPVQDRRLARTVRSHDNRDCAFEHDYCVSYPSNTIDLNGEWRWQSLLRRLHPSAIPKQPRPIAYLRRAFVCGRGLGFVAAVEAGPDGVP